MANAMSGLPCDPQSIVVGVARSKALPHQPPISKKKLRNLLVRLVQPIYCHAGKARQTRVIVWLFSPSSSLSTTTYENRFIRRQTLYGIAHLVALQNFENRIRIEQEYPPFAVHVMYLQPRPRRKDAFTGILNKKLLTVVLQWRTSKVLLVAAVCLNRFWILTKNKDNQSNRL